MFKPGTLQDPVIISTGKNLIFGTVLPNLNHGINRICHLIKAKSPQPRYNPDRIIAR